MATLIRKSKNYFSDVDEIWHAGDIGTIDVLDELKAFKPTRAVWGNIDNHQIRQECKEFLRFKIEEVEILMTHIGGKPERYSKPAYKELEKNGAPTLFVCGHSHITLVKMDKRFDMLWMNPEPVDIKVFIKLRPYYDFLLPVSAFMTLR